MIIFLDIDGVLATSNSYNIDRPYGYGFEPKCVEVLNKFIAQTSADIVISSTWRVLHNLDDLKYILKNENVECNIVGKTPSIHLDGRSQRGNEVLKWISDNNYKEDYVVIDDEIHDIRDVIPHDKIIWVKDGWGKGGIQEHHTERFLTGLKRHKIEK